MTKAPNQAPPHSIGVRPSHILAGLGSADRKLLAVCLALFEDSALLRRLEQIYEGISRWVEDLTKKEVQQATASVKSRMSFWYDSRLSDSELRLIVWIYMREAFELPARLTASTRGAEVLADELAAAAIHASDMLKKGDSRHVTLADLVASVMQELMAAALEGGDGELDESSKHRVIAETRSRLQGMGEADLKRLLEAVGAKELNDDAIRRILLTGGGLTAFSAGVGVAGFSAYILAAQASAFIPLISGPALVSAVAVVSNPVTVIAATGAVIWWTVTSAKSKSQIAVGLRVTALLGLHGFLDISNGLANTLTSFGEAESLKHHGDLDSAVLARYKSEWKLIKPALIEKRRKPSREVLRLLNRRALDGVGTVGATRLNLGRSETENAMLLATLTLGDILYTAAAINPAVIGAADFSRLDEIAGPLDFGALAQKIMDLSPEGVEGAMNNLKGYVAEQLVATELVAQGHDVAFPQTPNEPGWDILVDGHKFQVKWHEDIGGLSEHFEKYEFPVLANSELAGNVPTEWASKVYFVEGYSDELVTHVTERSVEAGADVLHPDVPMLALSIIAARNLMAYREGSVSAVQAAEQIVLDGGTRAGLAVIGGYAGAAMGLLIFGPAGGLVLGSVVPILSQTQAGRITQSLDKYVKSDSHAKWERDVHDAIGELMRCLRAELEQKLALLRVKYRAFEPGGIRDYIRARLEDEATFLRESGARLEALGRRVDCTSEERALHILRWVASSTIHPVAYQSEMGRLREILVARPPLSDRVREIAGSFWATVGKVYSDARQQQAPTEERKKEKYKKKKDRGRRG